MDPGLAIAIVFALAFSTTNGLHDASNAIATLVATRAATPLQAILLASVFNLLGPLFLGAAVADTIGGIVTVPPDVTVEVIGAGLAAAVTWNLVTWRLGLPSSSGHALVGGLVGAAVVEGGVHAINWGGIEDWRPVGVFGILIALALSPVLGGVAALLLIRAVRRRRAPGHPALAGAGEVRGVGDVGRARVQPRRQRRPEVDRRDRGAAARRRGRSTRWRRRRGRRSCAPRR